MINLLPPKEKNKLLLEKKKKIVVIFWSLVLFLIFCLILALISIQLFLQIEIKLEKNLLNIKSETSNQQEMKSFKQKVQLANSDLKKLNSFYQAKIYFSDILGNISGVIPKEVFLYNISITPLIEGEKTGGKGRQPVIKVSLSGFCPTREILFKFRKKLEEKAYFKDVYFPPSNWIKPVDINFSLTLTVNKKQ